MSEATPVSAELKASYIAAMRRLAATVAIVTTGDDGLWHGMAATAVSSVTADPPALLVCVNQSASLHRPLLGSGRFCVNLLRSSHAELCGVFSGKEQGQDRFRFGSWIEGEFGIPYLEDSQASVFCTVDVQIPYLTHTVVIGRVTAVHCNAEISPLLYQDGAFAQSVVLPRK